MVKTVWRDLNHNKTTPSRVKSLAPDARTVSMHHKHAKTQSKRMPNKKIIEICNQYGGNKANVFIQNPYKPTETKKIVEPAAEGQQEAAYKPDIGEEFIVIEVLLSGDKPEVVDTDDQDDDFRSTKQASIIDVDDVLRP